MVIVYAILSAAVFVAMKQTPIQFGSVMSKLPTVSMIVLPF